MKFRYCPGDRRILVPEICGVKKPVFDKKNNTYEYLNEDTQGKISQKIKELKEVSKILKCSVWQPMNI